MGTRPGTSRSNPMVTAGSFTRNCNDRTGSLGEQLPPSSLAEIGSATMTVTSVLAPPMPGGSWEKSARNVRIQPHPHGECWVILAELKRQDLTWRSASTVFTSGDRFENDNGHFEIE